MAKTEPDPKTTQQAHPEAWRLNEPVHGGQELRQFALNIVTHDGDDVISLTISDYLRILRGFARGFAFLTADNILDADESTNLRESIGLLENIADSADRKREIFGTPEKEV